MREYPEEMTEEQIQELELMDSAELVLSFYNKNEQNEK